MAVAGADAAKAGRDRGWAVVTIGDDGGVSVAFEPVLQPSTATVELLAIDADATSDDTTGAVVIRADQEVESCRAAEWQSPERGRT